MNYDNMVIPDAIRDRANIQARQLLNRRVGCLLLAAPLLALICVLAGVLVRMDAGQIAVLLTVFALAWATGFVTVMCAWAADKVGTDETKGSAV